MVTEVFLVEPDDVQRSALSEALGDGGYYVKAFGSSESMLIHLIRFPTTAENVRCCLVNEHQPGLSGLATYEQVRLLEPRLKFVFISNKTSVDTVLKAWRAGASGFLIAPIRPDELLMLMKQVFDQKVADNEAPDQDLVENIRTAYDRLTSREREVLLLVAKGCRNQEIAAELSIALPTVKMHRANLMRKLGLDNVAQLVSFQHQCIRFL